VAQKPETKFRKKFEAKYIKPLANCEDTSIQQLSLIGDPDKILCVNGWYVALEFKAESLGILDDATPLQKKKLTDIMVKGKGGAFVVTPTNAEHVGRILKRIDNGELPPWVRKRI
jgi:hypothetical protein